MFLLFIWSHDSFFTRRMSAMYASYSGVPRSAAVNFLASRRAKNLCGFGAAALTKAGLRSSFALGRPLWRIKLSKTRPSAIATHDKTGKAVFRRARKAFAEGVREPLGA